MAKPVTTIPAEGEMQVPLRVYASPQLFGKLSADGSLSQGKNVAALPGIVSAALMMPDAHQGYGFPIGGVAAFDAEEGIVTPGGIGFDINCGVRLLSTSLSAETVRERIDGLLDKLFSAIPSGVGVESDIRLDAKELDAVLSGGSAWALSHGYGLPEDAALAEEEGSLPADPSKVSQRAKARGRKQLGTLGSGNHFLEVQAVEKIYDKETAAAFGIIGKGQVMIMIHCGSRGLGHQVCSDYLRKMADAFPEIMASLPEKDLMYAPLSSSLAQDYLSAMNAAANFAWANRQVIAHRARKAFSSVFPSAEVHALYDVAHNIAKRETHIVDGEPRSLLVHRKGATRAFGPQDGRVPLPYRRYGQPVLIPGSMGTASYVLVGTPEAMEETFGSSAHGAGRTMSRVQAKRDYPAEKVRSDLLSKNIHVKAASLKGISEEAPLAYKDIDEVVRVTEEAGISRPVARLVPIGVIKG